MGFSILKKFRSFRSDTVAEFYTHVDYLLENEQVKKLDDYIQHYCFSRLQHSIDVAYYSFFISRLFGWDSKSVARAGLLHDLFLYDRHSEDYTGRWHLRRHPMIALENAKKICSLNKIEVDIIEKHMWLITLKPPRYKESYVVTFVDKYCALRELALGVMSRSGGTDVVRKCGSKHNNKEKIAA